MLTNDPKQFASQCAECLECLEKCSRHLDIPHILASIAEEMEGGGFEERYRAAREMFEEIMV